MELYVVFFYWNFGKKKIIPINADVEKNTSLDE